MTIKSWSVSFSHFSCTLRIAKGPVFGPKYCNLACYSHGRASAGPRVTLLSQYGLTPDWFGGAFGVEKLKLSDALIQTHQGGPPYRLCITSDWIFTRERSARIGPCSLERFERRVHDAHIAPVRLDVKEIGSRPGNAQRVAIRNERQVGASGKLESLVHRFQWSDAYRAPGP
jgi:hypothetical protein